ncbi:FHA domain-containing protein [candidate division KSB1 bacterium]|nr:FHA domain-containing protein [candidate division KSB1 bacterium]
MAQLVCIEGMKTGLTLNIEEGQSSLGRGGDNDLVLPHPSISRKHALLKVADAKILVTDLESKNGTFINNNRLVDTDYLKPGDTIKFGEVSFTVKETLEEPPKSRSEQSLEVKLICQEGLEKGFEFIFNSNVMTLGRERMNNIPILHRSISRRHCKFSVQAGRVRVEDLQSLNGTIVNGQKVTDAYLRDRDLIVIGDLKFIISIKPRTSELPPVSPAVIPTPPQIQIQRDFEVAEDYDHVDVEAIDGSLLIDRKVVPRFAFKAIDISESRAPELPEKEFLDTTLTLELERQKLFLLFKISLELANLNKPGALGANFEKYCQQLFGSPLFLVYLCRPINASLEQVAKTGNLNPAQFGPFLKELFKTKHKPVILHTDDKLPSLVRLRPDLEGKAIYLSPLLAQDTRRIGYIIFISPKDFKETDLNFFRLFQDLMSKKFETILESELK